MLSNEIKMVEKLLEKLGLSRQEIKIYLTLLNSGPASIRQISSTTDINRGTVYELLKKLTKRRLATYYTTKNQKHFTAENPEIIKTLLKKEKEKIIELEDEISESLPHLKAFYQRVSHEQYIKIYKGISGVKFILEDLLNIMKNKQNKEYAAYSSSDIKKYLCKNFTNFNDRRIAAGIKAKIIVFGKNEGLNELNEIKLIDEMPNTPAYIIIYADKIALISLDKDNNLISVLIEDLTITAIQKAAFERLWELLK